ncbi:hypothetical protein BDN72DRAFT_841509 [Pluteus cervinus]|uniref:Uncharacterized protein n=1 Tax=Pluteus cervinus TaxID=181527 RepID=A0ACD3AT25_9AGAR|nr:hypothetical protein BDN72DRAFT_841509 [Pluteus cervinus]
MKPPARCILQLLGPRVSYRRSRATVATASRSEPPNVAPDPTMYQNLLHSASRAGFALEAWAILDDMLLIGLQPTTRPFYQLLWALRHKHSTYAWKVGQKMDQLRIPPDTTIFSLSIHRFIRDRNLEMALRHLYIARSRDILPTTTVVCAMTQLAAELGFPRLAVDLAISYGIQTTGLRNRLVWANCLRSSADHFYAEGVLTCWDVMKESHLDLDLDEGLCSLLLDFAARTGLPNFADEVLQRMREMGYNVQEH